jgi:NADH dehydrogenase
MRQRILFAFEAAELENDPVRQAEWLTFVVVGGGPTGVELAGAVGELSRHTLRDNFRIIRPENARIILVECADRVLPVYPSELSAKAALALERIGVTVRTSTVVTAIHVDGVVLQSGDKIEEIATHTVLWGAGVEASPLAKLLAGATAAGIDGAGRIIVEPDLSLPGRSEVFAIGDMTSFAHQTGKPLPGVAQVAMQQGAYVADLVRRRLRGAAPRGPFRYHDKGSMATIGRNVAVADFGWLRFNGRIAWLAWLFIHILYLIAFENRLLVFMQWAWNYFTRNRSARLITRGGSLSGEGERGAMFNSG